MTYTASCTTTSNRLLVVLLGVAALLAGTRGGWTCAARAQASEKRTAAERLKDELDTASLKSLREPWHLKMSVTLVDPQGGDKDATIETWHAGADSRTVLSFGNDTLTTYAHADKRYQVRHGSAVPEILDDVLDTVLHPGPYPQQLIGTKPDVRTETFGKVPLECVMLRHTTGFAPGRLSAVTPLGVFPTWCMVPQTGHLQLIYSIGNPTLVVTGLGKFLGREVITGFTMSEGVNLLARGKMLALSTFQPAESDFVSPADAKLIPEHLSSLASNALRDMKTGGLAPEYPVSARVDHVSGSVVLRAIIGKDGRVRRLVVVSTPGADLAISALQAVRTWTYKPYLLDGEPSRVEATITVNYNLSPG